MGYKDLKFDKDSVFLVTGGAGFIGSNLLETLLKLDQRVIGLDNFATGYQRNLDEVQTLVTPAQWSRFNFILGDIRQLDDCRQACTGIDLVLHQAALGSVPRSLEDPITTNATNIDGFLNMLVAARDQGVEFGVAPACVAALHGQLVGQALGGAAQQVTDGLAADDGVHGVSLY